MAETTGTDLGFLKENYEAVCERLDRAVRAAGRARSEVALIAVSKLHPAEMVLAVAALGQVDFGENYVQEALEKREACVGAPGSERIRWHMIGHVQSRKAPKVAGAFPLIHTLDSLRLAQGLEKRCAELAVTQEVLVEVNVGDEEQKSGVRFDEVARLVDDVQATCPHLALRGLMCIPPVYNGGEAARPYFAALRETRDRLVARTGLSLPHLSMGMSGDFEWAVLEGATFVRVGTDIFGARPPKKNA